jgi:hypothetical protein
MLAERLQSRVNPEGFDVKDDVSRLRVNTRRSSQRYRHGRSGAW